MNEPTETAVPGGHATGEELATVRARQQGAVAALGVRALAGLELPALMQEAADTVARELGVEFVKVVELLPDSTDVARVVAGVGWKEGVVGTATITVGPHSQAGYALLTREPVVVVDLASERRLADPPLLRDHGVVSGMSVILYGPGGSAYGVLGAHTAQRRQFTGDDVAFLQGIANVLSAAMHRQHVEDELRRAHAEAEAFAVRLQEQATELEQQTEEAQALAEELEQTNAQLQHAVAAAEAARAAADVGADRARRLLVVSGGLSRATTPEQVAEVIFREGMAAVGADAGSLALLHEEDGAAGGAGRQWFETVQVGGLAAPLVERYRRYPVTPGRPLSDAVLSGAPRLIASRAEWRRLYPDVARETQGIGYEALAAVPVLSGGRALGALAFSFRDPVAFDEGMRTFLATLGEQCGLALGRARAFEAERRAREASTFLADASRLLAESLEYETTLRAVAEAAVPRLGDWCTVDIVRDPTSRTWPPQVDRLAIVHPDPAKLALAAELARRYPTDWSAEMGLAAVLRDGTPLFMPVVSDEVLARAARDAAHLALLREVRFSSVIVVPLVARGLTLGALTLCMAESGRRYDADDLALAQDLARRAAVAVDNARLFREAEAARRAAQEANEAKSQFLANMSHELRTPLNAIAGHVELLEMGLRGPVTGDQQETLGRVRRAQRHLLGLINDVLDFAKLESGRIDFEVEALPLAEVVAEAAAIVEGPLAAKELSFEVEPVPPMPDGSPLLVWADREKLRQVLLNLLSNAGKFTPSGGRVTISVREPADTPELVHVRVTDTGIGIAPDKLDAIFEPFVQVEAGRTRTAQGTGLGLSISRSLAAGLGGSLTAESTPGAGSTFTVALRRVTTREGRPVDRRSGEPRRMDEERRSGEDRREDGEPPDQPGAPPADA